ncbi:VWA domain-containing protein [Cognatilysobacter bugurensis]|uniref:Membrane protein n=1 Tax=Cognatilysobacter bugurensis TaxID=543356 RepID=A0A918T1I5_9GAMM|nr:VWA domain-containing protein [Lysobacter bugurensis]GHA84655.1 membrane protein [Lysobacter bugurensis]
MSLELGALHLLRPQWLWALLALPLLAWWWTRASRAREPWRDAIDAHLQPHLLEAPARSRRWAGPALVAASFVLSVIALAGPSLREVERPLAQGGTPLVIAVDLSSAALAPDLPPSRLAQARGEITRLLEARDGAPVALIAYADDAFTVAPLTEDAANVALFLDALAPEVMPVDGRNTARAIEHAVELLRRADQTSGDIVLLTGEADPAARDAAAAAAQAGHRVSVLGLGSPTGALVRTRDGAVRAVRLEADALRGLARAGDGEFAALQPGDADLRSLGLLDPGRAADARGEGGTRVREDQGYWLLPPLMLLGLLALRHRAGLAVLVLFAVLPWSPAHAVQWWERPDQAAHERIEAGNEAYRRGEFDAAAALYRSVDSADAHYNRGNALARQGQYREAITAYDAALAREPGMPDAIANRRAVAAALKRKPPPGPKSDKPKQGSGEGEKKPGSKGPAGQADSPPPEPSGDADPQNSKNKPQPSPKPDDASARDRQREADAAQRERMRRAMQQQGGEKPRPDQAPPPAETPAQRERRIANEAWLRRVPDEPGGLLRAKFRLEHERRQQQEPTP